MIGKIQSETLLLAFSQGSAQRASLTFFWTNIEYRVEPRNLIVVCLSINLEWKTKHSLPTIKWILEPKPKHKDEAQTIRKESMVMQVYANIIIIIVWLKHNIEIHKIESIWTSRKQWIGSLANMSLVTVCITRSMVLYKSFQNQVTIISQFMNHKIESRKGWISH